VPETTPGSRLLSRFMHLLALSSFAVAQPLLDLLRRHAEFLVVHRTHWSDLAALIAVLVLVPPLCMWLLELLVGTINRRAARILHQVLLALLLSATLVPILDAWPVLAGAGTLGAAVGASLGALWTFRRFDQVRGNLALLALVVPVFVGVFVLSDAVRSAVSQPEKVQRYAGPAAHDVPVVLVILDELPLTSLLDRAGGIDADLFPNFARLARHATWYPRASSISGATMRAVPSILAGRLSGWDQPPNLNGHPENIFTVLGGTHRIIAQEGQTSLCPDEFLVDPVPSFGIRLRRILSDVAVLYRYVVYPASFRSGLPPIDNRWSGFAADGHDSREDPHARSRHAQFRDFVARIHRSDKPLLAVIHTLLPHSPYRHYPDGTIYYWREGEEHVADGIWIDDPAVVRDAFRRHLIQTVSVDRLLGEMMDRLDEQGILDGAMVVVTADHGACFTPGQPNRRLSEDNVHDIMAVPLLIKYPGQRQARQDRRFVQSIDIYPTILETVGLAPTADLDGFSLVDPAGPDRTELEFLDQDRRIRRTFPVQRLGERNRTRQWKYTEFHGLADVSDIYDVGTPPVLLGRATATLPIRDPARLVCILDGPQRFHDVRLGGNFLPGEITGELAVQPGAPRTRLAVAVRGIVVGYNESYLDLENDGSQDWAVLVPESVFGEGLNPVEVFLVAGQDDDLRFRLLATSSTSRLGVQ